MFVRYVVAILVGAMLALGIVNLGIVNLGGSSDHSQWTSVYSHDKDGKSINGSKDTLIKAVRSGKSIRISWKGRVVEHLIDAHFITLYGDEVFAQITIQGQKPNAQEDKPNIELRDAPWHAIISTNGDRAVTWFVR